MTTPWKCPTCNGKDAVYAEHPVRLVPCPTCLAFNEAVAAAVAAAKEGWLVAHASTNSYDESMVNMLRASVREYQDALSKQTVQLMNIGAEAGAMREALQFVAGCGDMAYAKRLQEDDHVCDLDHKDEMSYGDCIEKAITALSAPASREWLERHDAATYRAAAERVQEFGRSPGIVALAAQQGGGAEHAVIIAFRRTYGLLLSEAERIEAASVERGAQEGEHERKQRS